MARKRFPLKTKIYDVPDVGELRRIRRSDGISFTTALIHERESDKLPVSIDIELQLTRQHGNLLVTMRRIARRPDSWYCTTSSIRLPPRAAIDLIQSLSSLKTRLKP